MPGIVSDEVKKEEQQEIVNESNGGSKSPDNNNRNNNNNMGLNPGTSSQHVHHDDGIVVDTSIEKLYENLCDMHSSDQSPSRHSGIGSDAEESKIDSELRNLVGGEMREVEIIKEEVEKPESEDNLHSNSSSSEKGSNSSPSPTKPEKKNGVTKKDSEMGTSSSSPLKPSPSKGPEKKKLPRNVQKEKTPKKQSPTTTTTTTLVKKPRNSPLPNGSNNLSPDLGPFLLKQARDLISSGDSPQKALELALRASKSFETASNGKPSLELVMCLHVTAAIYCSLGQYNDAIPLLEHSIEIPYPEEGQNQEHALAKFAGHMQLGDTYAMLGQLENSISCYSTGLEVQRQALGPTDPRVGETCRYLAEAHVQALQFDKAERFCQMALDIHKENHSLASLEEAADRRLMGLICETKGDHEAALEHLVLASMSMVANGQEMEVAVVDCSIGDTYLSLSRYDEAVFAYQKALTVFKTTKGENHPSVGSVFVRLAELYNKTGKVRESKSYCENALRIYEKPIPGISSEEIASGLTNVSAIYESMNELEHALKLLEKALRIYNSAPGQQNMVAGIEAQMGVMYYMLGNYSASYDFFKNAISKLRAIGEKKSPFFGIALNQMGLACVQRYAIDEAIELFEEARTVFEQECGPYHTDTLGVYSNLAGTYDAVGRLDEAVEILEYVVGMREEKLGTASPEVDDEKRRLAELLKETGRVRNRKVRSLENLLDSNSQSVQQSSSILV